MKKDKAIKLAIDCIEQVIKTITVDANLYDKGLGDYPAAKKSSDRRKQLLEVIEFLKSTGTES